MTALRRLLARIASCWLLCTVAGLATAPMALHPQSLEAELECTCGHGDHAMCPMHHRSTTESRCAMRALADDGVALLQAAIGGVGLVPAVSQPLFVGVTGPTVLTVASSLLGQSLTPDSPPPRA